MDTANTWHFKSMLMGTRFNDFADTPFTLLREQKLDAKRTLHFYTLPADECKYGPLHCERIVYIFNHNNILKDIHLEFINKQEGEELRNDFVALFGEPQQLGSRAAEEWYHNSVLFSLTYSEKNNPPGLLIISLLTPCKNY